MFRFAPIFASNTATTSTVTGYDVLGEAGSYAYIGIAAKTRKLSRQVEAAGVYTYTGKPAVLTHAFRIIAAKGTIAVTGQSAIFPTQRGKITADKGNFAVTGNILGLRAARKVAATVGARTLTGFAIKNQWGHKLVAIRGIYVLSGKNAIVKHAPLKLLAGTGVFTLTGIGPVLRIGDIVTIEEIAKRFDVGTYIELFDLDTTPIGGTEVMHFTSSAFATSAVIWRGLTYTPVNVEATGFEWNGRGTFPTPTIRVVNIGGLLTSLLITYGDLVGAKVTRWRTFKNFLDGQPDADAEAHFSTDVFNVERKASQNRVFVEFELSAAMDQEGRELPGRVVTRFCTHTYRRWNGTEFVYTKASCPYTDAFFFDQRGNATTAENDSCNKLVNSGCKLRFNDALPFRGFPGVGRVR